MNKFKALIKVMSFFYTELTKYSIVSSLYYLFSSFSTTISTILLQTVFDSAYNVAKHKNFFFVWPNIYYFPSYNENNSVNI